MDSTRHRTCTLNWLFFHCWRKNCQNCKWLKYFMIYLFLWFSESYCMNKFILPLFIWKPCTWQVQNNDQPTESLARQNINGHLSQKIVCWLAVISLWIKASYGVTIQMNIFSSTFRRCYMFYSILQNEIWPLLVVEGLIHCYIP